MDSLTGYFSSGEEIAILWVITSCITGLLLIWRLRASDYFGLMSEGDLAIWVLTLIFAIVWPLGLLLVLADLLFTCFTVDEWDQW